MALYQEQGSQTRSNSQHPETKALQTTFTNHGILSFPLKGLVLMKGTTDQFFRKLAERDTLQLVDVKQAKLSVLESIKGDSEQTNAKQSVVAGTGASIGKWAALSLIAAFAPVAAGTVAVAGVAAGLWAATRGVEKEEEQSKMVHGLLSMDGDFSKIDTPGNISMDKVTGEVKQFLVSEGYAQNENHITILKVQSGSIEVLFQITMHEFFNANVGIGWKLGVVGMMVGLAVVCTAE